VHQAIAPDSYIHKGAKLGDAFDSALERLPDAEKLDHRAILVSSIPVSNISVSNIPVSNIPVSAISGFGRSSI